MESEFLEGKAQVTVTDVLPGSTRPQAGPVKFSGSSWVENSYKCKLSPRIRDVMDVIGQVWAGIYHINCSLWTKELLETRKFVLLKLTSPIATYDDSVITGLVILCHDLAIRLEIRPGILWSRHCLDDFYEDIPSDFHGQMDDLVAFSDEGPHPYADMPGEGYEGKTVEWEYFPRPCLDLHFHPRTRDGDGYTRHPTLEENVGRIRDKVGLPLFEGNK